jgi:hypothetical protein
MGRNSSRKEKGGTGEWSAKFETPGTVVEGGCKRCGWRRARVVERWGDVAGELVGGVAVKGAAAG